MTHPGSIEFETPWFQIERATETLSGEPYYLLRAPDAVIVFALTADNQIVLVRQKRIARGGFTIECPAGAIEAGELPEEAARRELREEAGFDVSELHALSCGGLGLDRDTAIMHGFVAFGAKKLAGVLPEEGVTVQLMPVPEFVELVKSGGFQQLGALGVIFNALLCFKELSAEFLPSNTIELRGP